MTMIENFPVNLASDLATLTKNGWAAEVTYSKTLPGYKVRATRKHWVLHFRYLDEGGAFSEGHLFKNGDMSVNRKMTREQVKRFAGMSDEGREANYGKATI